MVSVVVFETQDVFAVKGEGVSNPKGASSKICGDQLCDEPMTTEEKIRQYLAQLAKKQEDERAFGQGRFQIGGVSAQARFVSCQSIDNPFPAHNDFFGGTIAANDEKIVISAVGDDTGARDAGIVYVFDRTNCNLLLTIENPDPANFERFGESLAILGTDKIIVGTPRESSQGANVGKVYVFDINSGNPLFTITNPVPNQDDFFGLEVGTFGNDIVVGAHGFDGSLGLQDLGVVYLFDGTNGNQFGSLHPHPPHAGDHFGGPFEEFGNQIVIGAPQATVNTSNEGAVFIRDPFGVLPSQTITGPTSQQHDQFGLEFTIINDLIVIGEPTDRQYLFTTKQGTAHTYDLNSGSLVVTIDDPEPGWGEFGWTMASYAPECVAIATPRDDRGITGGAYDGSVYIFNARTGDYISKIQPTPTNSSFTGIRAGMALATTSSELLVGVPNDYVSDGADGRVLLYSLDPCIKGEGTTPPPGGPPGSTAQYIDLVWDASSFTLTDSNFNLINSAEVGKQFHLSMDIKNIGNINSPPFDFLLQFWDNANNRIKYYQHHTYNNILAPGQTDTITVPIMMQISASFSGSFSADSRAVIVEINELNNREFYSLDIVSTTPIPPPTFIIVELDQQVYFLTDKAGIIVIDPPKNVDIHQQESFPVEVYSSASPHLRLQVIVIETGTDTGIFTEKVDPVSLVALVGEKFFVEYAGLTDSADVVSLPPPDFTFDKTSYDPAELVTATVLSHYDNTPNLDTVSVRIHSPSNPGIFISLPETSPNSAIFTDKIPIPPWAAQDGLIAGTFTDSIGNSVSVASIVIPNRPISIRFMQPSYTVNDTILVEITDDSANQNPFLDERIDYYFWSTSFPNRVLYDALETGLDTGEFGDFFLAYGAGDTFFIEHAGLTASTQILSTSGPGISITSVEPTDNQGNPVSQFSKGTKVFAKVVVDVNTSTSALVAVTLWDSNNAPLDVGTVQTTLPPGTTEFVISLSVPNFASTGTGTIYANVFSDWPQNGGVPLTNEASVTVPLR